MFPGLSIQLPLAGNPFKITLPVAKLQLGWVIVPTVGGVGIAGCALISTLTDAPELHPAAFLTEKV